jgi:hypothetical protein
MILKEFVSIINLAGGVDLSLWVRPTSYALSTTSFSVFPTAGSLAIQSIGNIYDYVQFVKLSTDFTPSYHVSALTNSFDPV